MSGDDEKRVYSTLGDHETDYDLVGTFSSITLGGLINLLDQYPLNKVAEVGIGNAHSYRGYYNELAFEPVRNVSVASMLDLAKQCVGKEFQGYKGGWYKMEEYTDVWISTVGSGGGTLISEFVIVTMLGGYPK